MYKFSDKTVRIWDWVPGSGYVERSDSPLRGHKYQVTCVRISPQGAMLASASVDGTAILWNLQLGVKLYTMVQVNGDAIRVCRWLYCRFSARVTFFNISSADLHLTALFWSQREIMEPCASGIWFTEAWSGNYVFMSTALQERNTLLKAAR